MKIFLYPFDEIDGRISADYDRFFFERWCRESWQALRSLPDLTEDPDEADLFVVSSTLRCVSFFFTDLPLLRRQLRSLPHWRGGRAHVVFDLTDRPRPIFRNRRLFVLKSAFHERTYRARRCVSIPQFPRFRFRGPVTPASERPHLAGFRGNLRAEHGDLRERLARLDDGANILVKTGSVGLDSFDFGGGGGNGEVAEAGAEHPLSHTSLIHRSKFALLPRASGYALSYRMVECMNAGAIPVILSDGYVLPFSEILDYDSFSVRVPEGELASLAGRLRELEPRAGELQAAGREVFERYFASTEKIVHTAMDICRGKRAAHPDRLWERNWW